MDKKKANSSNAYLKEDFRLFYINSPLTHEIDYHYHDFHKVFIFLNGKGEYWIEDKKYQLQPLDVVIIPAGVMHRPVVRAGEEYERIIIYISDDFFLKDFEIQDLFSVFEKSEKSENYLARISSSNATLIKASVNNFILDVKEAKESSSKLLQRLHVTEFLIHLNRAIGLGHVSESPVSAANPTIKQITDYISSHLNESISIDDIADSLFLNRSYIMHLFKKETGTTIGKYITDKRLFEVSKLIKKGYSKNEAALMCGFTGYSAFHYAYSKSDRKSDYSME